MAILNSKYNSPKFLVNGHMQTIYPHFFRRVKGVEYSRERIKTPDDDFIDLDWCKKERKKLVIISHGLEGNSKRHYVKGMVKALTVEGYACLAWTCRGCGEEMNKKVYAYHSGATQDLHTIIQHVLKNSNYDSIYLVGFSMGGNLSLKYLGEQEVYLSDKIKRAVVFSVPLDLEACCMHLMKGFNRNCQQRFLKTLKEKAIKKEEVFGKRLGESTIEAISDLRTFDDFITAPLHGFENAVDYYSQARSDQFLAKIKIPVLIVNAKNDPFLPKECYPVDLIKNMQNVYFEIPSGGGHVGFYQKNSSGRYWSEERAISFLSSKLKYS